LLVKNFVKVQDFTADFLNCFPFSKIASKMLSLSHQGCINSGDTMAKSIDSSPATKTRKAAKLAPAVKSTSAAKPQTTSKMQEPQTPRHAANPEERQHMIQTAAYHLAERDGFPGGRHEEYWHQAEAQVDQLLRSFALTESKQH
jgi:hypothetical protein